MAIIERFEVEEGFLDRIDLRFERGLNVLIGPRGAGKTSVIELLRFCLDSPAYTDRFAKAAREHALSVLGSGRLSVTLNVDGERFVVTRSANDSAPTVAQVSSFSPPIVLSQNEIEAVGLDARGRLLIIDGFRAERASLERREQSVLSSIKSLTLELREINAEIALIATRTKELEAARLQLAEAEAKAAEVERSVEAAAEQLQELDQLGAKLAALSVQASVFERTAAALRAWRDKAHRLIAAPPDIEAWPAVAEGDDPLGDVRLASEKAVDHVRQAEAMMAEALDTVEQLSAATRTESSRVDDQARELRRHAEELQEGAGAAARRLAELQEATSQLTALAELQAQRTARAETIRQERASAMDELESIRDLRFSERKQIAARLANELGPTIDVEIVRSGLHTEYASAIAGALRGSGLHYTKLAPQLAAKISPRELVDAIDQDNFETIAEVGGIAPDRARRFIDHIKDQGAGDLAAAPVEDAVVLRLLDGTGYKETGEMSTGQRCTVVLPILLRHTDQPLIVDQPEDHLDNAFIVGTLIHAVLQRPNTSQLIVSTHNPNIPVLGDAERVVVLDSDGKRGFAKTAGRLEDADVVTAITTIMEGGRKAFERRAEFYAAEFGPDNGPA